MDDLIRDLDDTSARRILETIAQVKLHAGAENVLYTPQVVHTLRSEFGLPGVVNPTSEAGLARAALLVLAEDPQTREAIAAMAKTLLSPQRYDAGTTIAITVAALIALQTHVRFEREKDGRWKLRIEKKPTNDRLLRSLVEKLLALSPTTEE